MWRIRSEPMPGEYCRLPWLFLLCASQLAVALMNWLSTLLVKARLLPRLDFSTGIVADCRTMVVVPTMITNAEGVDRLIETLEIHHLANRDPHLHFALLTDFPDAPEEVLPEDDALLTRIRAGVEMLNQKYPAGFHTCFFLFHRPRRWNPVEGLWMGYERKRGKLMEFNSLLRGGSRGCFSEISGETGILPAIKYVITLDTDTQLPRDAARQLVGTMAHPLNRPRFDTGRGVVTEGYGILQPRVGVSLPVVTAVMVCQAFRRRRGHRSIHPRGFRYLSGHLPRRLVHRQGDLRRGRLRKRVERTFSRECDSQP